MHDELVTLCRCWDLGEAQAIRASLAARGVWVHLDGEHQRGVLSVLGAAIDLRIMVPRSQLRLAHELASEILPDLPPLELDEEDDERGREPMPLRRALPEDLVDHPDDEDEGDEGDEDEDDEEDEGPLPRPKSVAAVLLLSMFGLTLGLVHIYAGRKHIGVALLGLAALGMHGCLNGAAYGGMLVGLVWLIDVIGGSIHIVRYNRKLLADHGKATA